MDMYLCARALRDIGPHMHHEFLLQFFDDQRRMLHCSNTGRFASPALCTFSNDSHVFPQPVVEIVIGDPKRRGTMRFGTSGDLLTLRQWLQKTYAFGNRHTKKKIFGWLTK